MTITRCRVHADDRDYLRHAHADEIETRRTQEWLAAQQLWDPRDIYVFQLEYDMLDCPMLRVWWMTKGDFNDRVDSHDLLAADWAILRFCRVSEQALRGDLPTWWQPDLSERAA